jgi:hypothetical protein
MEDPYVESVRKKLLERSRVGMAKYGVDLTRPDLDTLDWLIHAQEEAMDMSNYLEVLIQREQQRILLTDVMTTIDEVTDANSILN